MQRRIYSSGVRHWTLSMRSFNLCEPCSKCLVSSSLCGSLHSSIFVVSLNKYTPAVCNMFFWPTQPKVESTLLLSQEGGMNIQHGLYSLPNTHALLRAGSRDIHRQVTKSLRHQSLFTLTAVERSAFSANGHRVLCRLSNLTILNFLLW